MTPAARISAAIEVLDAFRAGEPAERALTNWARANRFAGSGDRAAIRDHVFDVIRRLNGVSALGGGSGGRQLMLGWCRAQGLDPDTLFTGARFAPAPLSAEERAALARPDTTRPEDDLPDWLRTVLQGDLGRDLTAYAQALAARAPVFLRVNQLKADPQMARERLEGEGFGVRQVDGLPQALEVTDNARRIGTSAAMAEGLVELQDLAPQRAVQALPEMQDAAVLDYCAGGGGKALALAARGARVSAHDISAARLAPLAERAARAGARVERIAPGQVRGRFDGVVADVPCSGSGTWRRTPEAKWRLTPARLAELTLIQDEILDETAALLHPGGWLAYMTCSVLRQENEARVDGFLARYPDFSRLRVIRWPVEPQGGDGFFLALLQKGHG